ncbi:type II toxin-antitoxin system RelE/ParE family toxin [Neorhizobium petrolearium]|uniref:type II toxin-antitoxin system RelE/ParE family toxin n=1 Tax=Neorhizobium petrolearium TaxID=515361 RepID=UPI003F148BAB
MPRVQYLDSAHADFRNIFDYVARESGSIATAHKFVEALRQKCRHVASLPGTMGRNRSELGHGLRSVAHRGYIIYFRYADNRFQIVNILEGHRDAEKHFGIDVESEDEG